MKWYKIWLFVIIVIMSAFAILIPRGTSLEAHWSSDEELWIERSFNFFIALSRGEWQDTFLSHHPGVITMWLGSIPLWFKYQDLTFMFNGTVSDDAAVAISPIYVDNLSQMRLAMVIFQTIIILIAAFLLWRLLGWRVALIAIIFLAYDPTYLAESRKLHTDAPAAGLVMLSILSILIYLEQPDRRLYILLSGISLGLACLAKSSAFILVLYVPLLVFLYTFWNRSSDKRPWQLNLSRAFYILFTWIGIAGLVFIAFWPAMWVARISIGHLSVPIILLCLPVFGMGTFWSYWRINSSHVRPPELITLSSIIYLACVSVLIHINRVVAQVYQALITPHEFPQMFLGQVTNDPHWTYYFVMVTIYSTPIVLLLGFSGLVSSIANHRDLAHRRNYRIILVLWLFVAIDLVCFSIIAKKLSRYILAVYPILDILAAISLGLLIEWILTRLSGHTRRFMKITMHKPLSIFAAILLVLAACGYQSYTVARLHPYYAAYYNPLWGTVDIKEVTTVGRGVGIDRAAAYLNQQENPENLVVRAPEVGKAYLSKYFKGALLPLESSVGAEQADYDVIYIRDIQLGLDKIYYENRTPVKTISVNGENYVYIYKVD